MDLIAVAGGPGSFTGVRIGLSAAKALAHPFNLPVVMISSLKGLAYNLPGYDGIVCPILDARRVKCTLQLTGGSRIHCLQ